MRIRTVVIGAASIVTLPLAHVQFFWRLIHFMPLSEVWRNVTSLEVAVALAPIGVVSLVASSLAFACIWPKRGLAVALGVAGVFYTFFIALVPGDGVFYGPLHLVALGVWALVAINTYREAVVQPAVPADGHAPGH